MNRLLLILILTLSFQSWTKADDISDFEIEGMSIGDSLLEHTNKEFILDKINTAFFYPNSKKFAVINFNKQNLKLYDDLNIAIKPKDSKFIIHSIKGVSNKDLDECLRIKKKVNNNISKISSNAETKTYTNDYNKTYGKTIAYIDDYYLKDGLIRTWCVVWDREYVKDNWVNSLNVNAGSLEWKKFLQKEAYK